MSALENRVRAAVLFALGCKIFPDSSEKSVKGLYDTFPDEIQQIT